ncbi:hypothetical protein DFH07DRAFT_840250 [Mycena maculata]|uniref:Uncharacterized protein n=1 Tax=Mycena maculata TaxID=230809 RepID=A0AAD7MZP0_9AGAR|nr:hypothetical protein DFH07DRAFT_840250 [Mycena maculata]
MHTSASTENFASRITTFRNPCGRRGCGHIFECKGPNPLETISKLVNEHWHTCPGRNGRSTAMHTPNTRPEPVLQERDDPPDLWQPMPSRRASSSPSSPAPSSSDTQVGGSESGTSSRTSRTPSPSIRSTRRSTPVSVASGTSGKKAGKGKKTSRTEAERRIALETDPWTNSVNPHDVLCRGCRRVIKLDRRSRYYPGLWEKHRDRCEHVSKMGRPQPPPADMEVVEGELATFAGDASQVTEEGAHLHPLPTPSCALIRKPLVYKRVACLET